MADPFASALSTLFRGPCAEAADYQAPGGPLIPGISVIHRGAEVATPFGDGRTVQGSDIFEIQRVEVAEPVRGGIVTIAAGSFKLQGDPMLDAERITWICGAVPLAG